MGFKKVISYAVAIFLGLLCVAPPINYNVPLTFNTFPWIYAVIVSGLFGFFLYFTEIHVSLKILAGYLFFSQFLSQEPATSFTACAIVVLAMYFFLLCKECDFEIIINMIQAVFWFEVAISVVQYLGYDRLMCFGSSLVFNDEGELVKQSIERANHVFFGTVFQQMRLASLFAIMSPFLLIKSKWYIIPLGIMAVFMKTLGLSFALIFGALIYFLLTEKDTAKKLCIITWSAILCVVCASTNNHIHIELMEGRWPIWGVVLKTWCFDTVLNFHGWTSPLNPSPQSGPFSWHYFLFGHGLDTFISLFQFYKYDPNPFPNPHNDWLKILWESGLVGFLLFCVWYSWHLISSLFKSKEFKLLAGVGIIAFNRLVAFPDCMTQTMFLMVAFLAYCEQKSCKISNSIYSPVLGA